MKHNKIYLTFSTDPETAYCLTELAHAMGKTQPELINELCKNFVDNATSYIHKKLEESTKEGNSGNNDYN